MVFTPRSFRFRFGFAWLVVAALLAATPATAQVLDNKGREFLMAFLPNGGGSPTIQVHLTGDIQTAVTVQYPAVNPTFTSTVNVTPGSVTIVTLPNTAAQSWTNNQISGNTVLATSQNEFVAYMLNLATATSDAALALPIDALNTEYIVANWTQSDAQFAVVAPFDGTIVTITPTSPIGSRPVGTPFTVELNRGQGFFAVGGTFSGTLISANRPVGVTNGNSCTFIVRGACDHIFEVAQPVQSWGTSIPVANLPSRPLGSIYRIFASENGTTVSQDGVALSPVLNRGQVLQTPELPGSHLFTANAPIFVVQFMTGSPTSLSTDGDPAMGNMVPSGQYGNGYTFATLSQSQFPSQFLTVIADNRDLSTIRLDGVAIGATAFTAIGSTGLSSAVLALTAGNHNTASTNPHGITVEGFGFFDSYLYPGGARFAFINPTGDANPPLCTLQESEPMFFTGSGQDNRPSEDSNGNRQLDPGEDLNGNGEIDEDTGIFSVQLVEGAQNLQLQVDPFVPTDGTVTFRITPGNSQEEFSGSVRVSDGAGNTCERSIGGDFPGIAFEDWAEDIEVDEGFIPGVEGQVRTAYLAVQAEGVKILDVTNPEAITTLASFKPPTCPNGSGTASFFADDVEFVESLDALFVAAGRCGVLVLDVANRAAPVVLGYADTPVWAEAVEVEIERFEGEEVIGFIADHNGGVRIVDFSPLFGGTPAPPVLRGAIGPSTSGWGTGAAIDVAFLDNDGNFLLFVANSHGLRVVDVNNPASPQLIGGYNTAPSGSPPEVPQDITLSRDGNFAFLAGWQAGLLTIDVSDPSAPVLANTISTTPGLAYYESEVVGNFVFATEGKGGLRTYQLSDGSLGPIEGEEAIPIAGGEGWAWDVQVLNSVAYVTYGILPAGTGGLAVIELEFPDGGFDFSNDPPPANDLDGDGVADASDNCSDVPNPGQADANLDGFGDACDADYNDDGAVNASDFSALRAAYLTQPGDASWNAEIDHNGDGAINSVDFSFFRERYLGAPGPSGLSCAGAAPCPSS